jgi:hypothetical protein
VLAFAYSDAQRLADAVHGLQFDIRCFGKSK